MKRKLSVSLLTAITLCVLVAIDGCRTQPKVIPPDLSAAESFQRAQDAADAGDHALAIRYYTTFRDNNPDNKDREVWALYEIAFNYHKMGKNALAVTYLNQLLDQYQNDIGTLPPAPRILAQDLKERLLPITTPAAGAAAAAAPAAAAATPAPAASAGSSSP